MTACLKCETWKGVQKIMGVGKVPEEYCISQLYRHHWRAAAYVAFVKTGGQAC